MISASTLGFSYDDTHALRDVSFGVAVGNLVLLAGANGGGKSTLLAILAGLASLGSGLLRVADLRLPGQERALRRISRLVVQDADLQILGTTVGEDLLLGRSVTDAAMSRAMAGRFGLAEAWDQPAHALSWGMRRKLCLAAALLDDPRLLLLDEPFAGLDYPGTLEMRRILAENRRNGLTQVVAAHDLDPVADLADQMLVLDRGRLVLSGPPDAVMDGLRAYGVRPPCSWLAGRALVPWDDGHD
ncbi:ATP-binding cassette domain-containing protein [Desulfovibrio aminophilus]|uniref:energy-coupling factor ABC transporter ATP-binding protein n=1 Tax=Desulfovibrio aminophilus TaxID=81425 RepID=UPI00339B26A4